VNVSAPDDLPMLLWPKGEPTKEDFGQWLPEEALLSFLQGKTETVTATKSGELFEHENRFGIGLNERRTTEDGALYEVEFIRPCDRVGLWVQVDGYDGWPASGVLRIGGEGRGAHFKKAESPLKWPLIPESLPTKLKMYFATPAYFSGGWRPNEGWSKFFDGAVTLQAVALNRYDSIGGYDWAAKPDKAQKPARRYVPAGSVYYFQRNGSAKLKQDAITEYGAEIGFGQVIIPETEWKEK
jgi:CRISPR-associated protein Cmr3